LAQKKTINIKWDSNSSKILGGSFIIESIT
jgi:hypothetical protein